jgi:hypothetical protein
MYSGKYEANGIPGAVGKHKANEISKHRLMTEQSSRNIRK